jgi:hypothetical protein
LSSWRNWLEDVTATWNLKNQMVESWSAAS